METRKKILIIVVMLVIALVNFNNRKEIENIRAIDFFSILSIGIFTGVLLMLLISLYKKK
jgi:uncharacterized membrane protein YpjA